MSRKEAERCPRNPSGVRTVVLYPTTGKEFSIGIDAGCFSLVGGKGIVTTAICPHCEGEHAWRLNEVRYSEMNNADH
jgi:hypothetical protein